MELSMFNIEEASEMLHIHPETLRRFIREGKIRAAKIGRRKLIMKKELENFIKKCSHMDISGDQSASADGK